MIKFYFWIALLFTGVSITSIGQNVAVNNVGAPADSSSMLDVQSTNKGFLIPRMTESQRMAIKSPATGLLVYQTNGLEGFYYNAGTPSVTAWLLIAKNNLPPTVTPGRDTAIVLANDSDSIKLAGSATDAEGPVVSYLWSQVAGPKPAIISSPGSPSTFVYGLTKGIYVFQLAAIDNQGATGVKSVAISINPTTIIEDNLLKGLWGYYNFDNGNFNDFSGKGHHMRGANGVSFGVDRSGNNNNALQFDGVNDYAVIDSGRIFPSGNFTVAFSMLSGNQQGRIFQKADYTTARGASLGFGFEDNTNSHKLDFYVSSDSNICSDYTTSANITLLRSDTVISTNTWLHVVIQYVNGVEKVYFNGELFATKLTPNKQAFNYCTTAPLYLGIWWLESGDPYLPFNGKIDDLRIYTRDLSGTEVRYLYNHLP